MTQQAINAYEELKVIRTSREQAIGALREGRFDDYDRISRDNHRGGYRNIFVSGGSVRDFQIGRGIQIN